jgi:hypothetical protein
MFSVGELEIHPGEYIDSKRSLPPAFHSFFTTR